MNPESDPLKTARLNLPVFEAPQIKHVGGKLTWEQMTEATEAQRAFYMARYDSDEKRLRDKNPKPFHLHGPREMLASDPLLNADNFGVDGAEAN
jgi:hypothetical protein